MQWRVDVYAQAEVPNEEAYCWTHGSESQWKSWKLKTLKLSNLLLFSIIPHIFFDWVAYENTVKELAILTWVQMKILLNVCHLPLSRQDASFISV